MSTGLATPRDRELTTRLGARRAGRRDRRARPRDARASPRDDWRSRMRRGLRESRSGGSGSLDESSRARHPAGAVDPRPRGRDQRARPLAARDDGRDQQIVAEEVDVRRMSAELGMHEAERALEGAFVGLDPLRVRPLVREEPHVEPRVGAVEIDVGGGPSVLGREHPGRLRGAVAHLHPPRCAAPRDRARRLPRQTAQRRG